jgi:hypothetical protein
MISEDILALVQLNPPGIEMCRVSNMKEDLSGNGPHMNKLCTLLLPPLQDGAHTDWAVCMGQHPGNQKFSRGPWPEYRHAPPHRQFRLSKWDSIVSVMIQVTGKEGRVRIYDMVVRCATLFAQATAAAAAEGRTSPSSNGGRVVPWAEWGPQATCMTDRSHVGWNDLLGELRVMIDASGLRIRISDYNPYRIRQAAVAAAAASAASSMPTKRHHGGRRTRGAYVDQESDDDKHRKPNRYPRIINKTSTIQAGEWFQDDVVTTLPYMDVVVYIPGCRAIHMQQDQLLLHVDDVSIRLCQ